MNQNNNYGKNMMAVESHLMGVPTFSLIPVTLDCPFVEAVFEPSGKTLIVFNKSTQSRFRMLPKLNDQGDPQRLKAARPNGEAHPEERKQMDSFMEHYITNPRDIRNFLKAFVVNLDEVDTEAIINKVQPVLKTAEKTA